MDDMGKFTASDDFSLGTNEDDGVSDLFGAAEAGPLDAFRQWAWATPGFIPWAQAQEERFGSWLEDEMPSRSDTRQYEIRLTSRWPAARPYLDAILATRTVGARRGDPVIGSDGMGFDLFKDVLPKIPIVGGIEAAFEPHSTQGVAAALGAIHEDEGYGVAPPRFGGDPLRCRLRLGGRREHRGAHLRTVACPLARACHHPVGRAPAPAPRACVRPYGAHVRGPGADMKRDPLLIEGVAYVVYVVTLIVWAYHSLPTVP